MLPIEFRDFINIFSLIVFGAVVVSVLVALVAYLVAIDRKKVAKKVEGLEPEEPEDEVIDEDDIPLMSTELSGGSTRDSFLPR